jgi:hypothetical protein
VNAKLPRTVVVLGLVSFFNDVASEIVVPLIPILLASVLGAGPVILGWPTRWRHSSSSGPAGIPMHWAGAAKG